MTQEEQNSPVNQAMQGGVQLFTVDETAEALRLHPQTIRRYIRAGELPVVRIGTAHRVHLEDIQRFLEDRRWRRAFSAIRGGSWSWAKVERALNWTPWDEEGQ